MKLVILSLLMLTTTAFSQLPPIEPGVSQELAKWRSVQYSNISYKLNLTLEKMSPVLKGSIEIHVQQAASACAEPNCPPLAIILDWRKLPGHEKDSTIEKVNINGESVTRFIRNTFTIENSYYEEEHDHLVFRHGVKPGDNVITLDFTSPILTSGSAITRYIDKEDGSEYIYSLFVPSDASTAFPVFDQPDLKARFTVNIRAPKSWEVVTNTELEGLSIIDSVCLPTSPKITSDLLNLKPGIPESTSTPKANTQTAEQDPAPCGHSDIWGFKETKPISTYVFGFAAGPWTQVSKYTEWDNKDVFYIGSGGGNPSGSAGVSTPVTANNNTLPTGRVSTGALPIHVYVRKSQATKFEQHAVETFRLTREAIKYLETYFDYKFPWPKYDLVLIPEFPFGGMEHAGATFLKESSVIFPTEPTRGDEISRANVIFHETAHQWFGDLVTMRWFDDLWLKEGFAEFMAYKTLEHVMPDANAWKVFYERNKQAAYATDSTRGTTPIYQPIANLSAAKSAYGNIVYRKAPSFLRQAEFYLGEDKFQTAVRAFLKKHEYANAGWEDLVGEFEKASGQDLKQWGNAWVKAPGLFKVNSGIAFTSASSQAWPWFHVQNDEKGLDLLSQKLSVLVLEKNGNQLHKDLLILPKPAGADDDARRTQLVSLNDFPIFVFPNYGDYGYGIFLLDDKSRDYVLKHIGEEKDPFLRSMMWGALWDSVREAELDPREYVELVIRQLPTEGDETIASSLLGRVSTALNYYIPAEPDCVSSPHVSKGNVTNGAVPLTSRTPNGPLLTCGLRTRFEAVLLDRMQHAETPGQRITFYRAFVTNATTEHGRMVLKAMLAQASGSRENHPVGETPPPLLRKEGSPNAAAGLQLRTKDKFDIVTRLIILNDPDAPRLLAELERTETSDDAKRYAYAAHSAFATADNRAKFWNDFVNNKDISESWIEAAIGPFNSIRYPELSQPYLERALKELPDLKRTRKIFFVNNWLSAWLSGQRDQAALDIVNKFLADNPNLDNDLRLKVLENVDVIERAVKIRQKWDKAVTTK